MGVPKAFVTVTALLAVLLLVSLARGNGVRTCKIDYRELPIMEYFEDDVNCTGQVPEILCFGTCDSTSTVEQRGRAVHWTQKCDCCQPHGVPRILSAAFKLNCTDGSTRSHNMTLVIPRDCQCKSC